MFEKIVNTIKNNQRTVVKVAAIVLGGVLGAVAGQLISSSEMDDPSQIDAGMDAPIPEN